MVSFIVFWEVMLRGCGLFHCVLGGYVERLWSLSLCCGFEVMLRGCGLFHCVLGGYVERGCCLSLCFGRLC